MTHASHIHGVPSQREQEYLAGWQRSRAELDNLRKRAITDHEQHQQRIRAQLGEKLVEVADNFTAITQHTPDALQKDSWAQGVLHVARQFEKVLTEYGITPITEEGKEFDPQIHEALAKVKQKGKRSGEVLEIVQAGYKIGDIVIRPAKVKVAE